VTLAAAHTAIRERFEAQWSDTPVQMPNVEFDIPETAWVRLNIDDASTNWASFGVPDGNTERHFGQVTVQLFTPSGEGEGLGLEYADLIKGIFRNWSDVSSGLRFLVPPFARQVGVDGKWYQINVVAPFQFDDFN
jgi:hypothetical protein